MENKEFEFKGKQLSGIAMLVLTILDFAIAIGACVAGVELEGNVGGALIAAAVLLFILFPILLAGFVQLEPGEARIMMFFGKYRGTFTRTGYYWVHPFIFTKKLSLRARNLDAEPIKVNDKIGNPVLIGLVLVWKLRDTYKAIFEIDSQTMAQNENQIGTNVKSIMDALEAFVKTQSDAALRQVAGQYAYDDVDGTSNEMTLRSGGDEIN